MKIFDFIDDDDSTFNAIAIELRRTYCSRFDGRGRRYRARTITIIQSYPLTVVKYVFKVFFAQLSKNIVLFL